MESNYFYLAHPFDSRKYIREWELKVEKKFGIELCNPFYDVRRDDIVAIDANRTDRYQVDPAAIVRGDLTLIRKSKGIVAIIDGALSYGTIMEIVHGCFLSKPVYIIVTNGHSQHPWIQYHAQKVFTTLKQFEKWIKKELK